MLSDEIAKCGRLVYVEADKEALVQTLIKLLEVRCCSSFGNPTQRAWRSMKNQSMTLLLVIDSCCKFI